MGYSMNIGNRPNYPSEIGNGSSPQESQSSKQTEAVVVQVGNHSVTVSPSERSEGILNAIKKIENLFKGRELIGAGVVAGKSLEEDGGESLVSAIRELTQTLLQGEVVKIKANLAFGRQINELYTSSQSTEQYLNSSEEARSLIDGHASSLESSQKKLEAAEKEGEFLLESPPSLSDLPQKVQGLQDLNEACNNVKIEAQILLGCLAAIGVPKALALVKGFQVNSNVSQSLNQDQDATGPAAGVPSSVLNAQDNIKQQANSVLGKEGRKADQKLEGQKAARLFDSKKELTEEALKSAQGTRQKREEAFLASEGNENAAKRRASEDGTVVREF